MDVTNNINANGYYPVGQSARSGVVSQPTQGAVGTNASSKPELILGPNSARESKPHPASPKAMYSEPLGSTQAFKQTVEHVRELKAVNVHPKNTAAIDTFLNVAYYTGGESTINTYV